MMGYGKYFHYGLKYGTVPPFQGAENPTDHADFNSGEEWLLIVVINGDYNGNSWAYFSDRL